MLTAFDIEARAETQKEIVIRAMRDVKDALQSIHDLLDVADDMKVAVDLADLRAWMKTTYTMVSRVESPVIRDAFVTLYAPLSARLDKLSGRPST